MSFSRWLRNGALMVAVLTVGASQAPPAFAESLLWNPGPSYRAHMTFTKTFSPADPYGCLASRSTYAEAHLVGNPPGQVTSPVLCEDMQTVAPASNGAGVSVYQTAHVGWTSADHEEYPGWAVWWLSGGAGTPIVKQFLNHARTAPSPCSLRELGYSYQNWEHLPHSHFKPSPSGERFALGDFDAVLGKATVKRTYAAGPLGCTSLPTGVINIDLRVAYENPDGGIERSDVLGVIIDVMQGTVDMNGVDDEIFYANGSGSAKLLYADRIGLSNLTTSWKDYSIDFKALIQQHMQPPLGFSTDDATIVGFDVYSSVRGGDLDFAAKNLDVVGVD